MTASEIRACLEGLPCPICTKAISDEKMEQLLEDVDEVLIARFGTCDTESSGKVSAAWWAELEKGALETGGVYYEDMDDAEEPAKDKLNCSPAPWSAGFSSGCWQGKVWNSFRITDADGRVVCDGPQLEDALVSDTNGILIKQAPRMHELLAKVETNLHQFYRGVPDTPEYDEAVRTLGWLQPEIEDFLKNFDFQRGASDVPF